MEFTETVEIVGKIVDLGGVFAIVLGIIVSTVIFLGRVRGKTDYESSYVGYRRSLGRALLLGLELLVAADIIRTIAITPTLESVAVLGGIVLIRTFLSFALELEISGKFPWQKSSE
ncbi:MAG: DUF1622 domain-containing protein [Thermomicrobiales bacterium]